MSTRLPTAKAAAAWGQAALLTFAAGDSMGDYTMLTEFKNLELALLFMRNWRESEMFGLVASGGKVAPPRAATRRAAR